MARAATPPPGFRTERADVDHDPALPVRVRGRVRRHAGRRASEHAQLRHSHHGRRRLELLDDRLCRGAVDAVHEHRARSRDRVELLVAAGLEDRWIALRPDHVGDRLCERAERRHGALPGLDLARVDEHGKDDQAPCCSAGRNGIGGAGMTFAIARELLGRCRGRGDEAVDRVCASRAGPAFRRRPCRARGAGTGTGSRRRSCRRRRGSPRTGRGATRRPRGGARRPP